MSWYALAIVAAVFFALEGLVVKYASRAIAMELILAYYFLFASILLFGYTYFVHRTIFSQLPHLPLLFLLGTLGALGVATMFFSYQLAPNVGYVRAMLSLSIVIAYILYFPLFGGKFDIYGLIAIVLIITGTLLFSKVS